MKTISVGLFLLALASLACDNQPQGQSQTQPQTEASQPRSGSWLQGPRDFSERTSSAFGTDRYTLNLSPEHVPAADAALGDGDLVMGVVINGEARAYPVNYMNGPKNEVVNDTLGGQAIASTW